MGIILVSIALLIFGLILMITDFDITGGIASIVGLLGFIYSIAFLIAAPINGRNDMLQYEQDKIVIELTYNSEYVTGAERTNAINLANRHNMQITKNQVWSKNKWVGAFFYKPINDLPLFDLNKISRANASVEINGN